MKLHLYTKESAPYSFENHIDIIKDEEFRALLQEEAVEDILNGDDVRDSFYDGDLSTLETAISSMFDMTTNGVFDWNEKTGEYYDLFERMIRFLDCNVEYDSGEVIAVYDCELSERFHVDDNTLYLTLINFYSGNGEPIGAQLALDLVECFIKANNWNIGFYDAAGNLITDIASWSKKNKLNIQEITPIIWFGHLDDIQECWSITPNTSDLFIDSFWNNYYEGALEDICDASAGLGLYYSVWEYGLEYDESLFEGVKSRCPVDLGLANVERANALYNLIVSIYNEHKNDEFPVIQKDLYLQDVIECDLHITSDVFHYSYTKPYRFKPIQLGVLDKSRIEEILFEDSEYIKSFVYLKDTVIDRCDLSSCQNVRKSINSAILIVQEQLNNSLSCQIQKNGRVLQAISYSVDLSDNTYLPQKEIYDIVFMKALIEFFKRGYWHIGYKEPSQLPQKNNAYSEITYKEGAYPVVWFNDSDEIIVRLGIWNAQEQSMLSITWRSVSDLCTEVFFKNDLHYYYGKTALYSELEKEFNRVKAECPIQIRSGKEPVDFTELEEVVKRQVQE